MTVYDTIRLPETFDLPGFEGNPAYEPDGDLRLWQTWDLTCGLDRYRLRPVEDDPHETHRLERRVPPARPITGEGAQWEADEPDLEYWNIVCPTGRVTIASEFEGTRYEYVLLLERGCLSDVSSGGREEVTAGPSLPFDVQEVASSSSAEQTE